MFPLTTEAVHRIQHSVEPHCKTLEHHIHKHEHHCNLCDFTFGCIDSPYFANHNFVLSELRVINFFFSENNLLIQKKNFSSLRAPPALV